MGTSLAACNPWRMAWVAIGVCHSQGVQIRTMSATSVVQASFHALSSPVKTRGALVWNWVMRSSARWILSGLMSLMAVISACPWPISHSSMSIKLLPRLPNPNRAIRTVGKASVARSNTEPWSLAACTRSANSSASMGPAARAVRPAIRPPNPSRPPCRNFRLFMPSK